MMKARTITIFGILGFAICCMMSHSCANTTTPPSGGPKDTIPPVLLNIVPENGTVNFPRFGEKLTLTYNEYTVVKDQNRMTLSPPHRKRPSAKVKGKNIVVTFNDTLNADQTYTLDFGDALADNNEGNIAPRLVYTFSTGETIDSMYFTGSVISSTTLAPVKNAIVAIYSDLSDSACLKKVPDAAFRSDDWGFFVIRNIKPIPYRLYAFSDMDNDYIYNPDTDEIAFSDTEIVPSKVVRDSIFELGYFQMKDTLRCKARKADIQLTIFKEHQSVQYLQDSKRVTDKSGYLKFSAGDAKINSLEFWGLKPEQIITQFNQVRDSMDFWIDSKYRLPDSLMVKVNYMKTDSTGVLVEAVEDLSLAVEKKDENKTTLNVPGKSGAGKVVADTTFKFTVTVSDETVQKEGFSLLSKWPLRSFSVDSITFTETNPKGQKKKKEFIFSEDSLEIRRFLITPKESLTKGYDYTVVLPQGTFVDITGLPNEREEVKFKIPQDEKLSFITLSFKNCEVAGYIVEITDESGKKIVRTYYVDHDQDLELQYMKAGKYMIRIVQDVNGNRVLDTGNLLQHMQPEKSRYYEYTAGNSVLEVPESTELTQEIDLRTMFK